MSESVLEEKTIKVPKVDNTIVEKKTIKVPKLPNTIVKEPQNGDPLAYAEPEHTAEVSSCSKTP